MTPMTKETTSILPHLDSYIPIASTHGIYISQIIRFDFERT